MTTQKKKLNRADFQFVDKTGEELIKRPGDINGIEFKLVNLKDCTVYLLDHMA
jgi:protein XRP2